MAKFKKMSNLDKAMAILGLVLAIIFVVSVLNYNTQLKKDAMKVSSISEIAVPQVASITPTRATGVITAEEWKEYYPEIYASHKLNENNTGHNGVRLEYPNENKEIQTLYQGMAFSFDYDEAIGHSYTLEDIAATTRPHKLANCLTCKTPDFTALVNKNGVNVYSTDFQTIYDQVSEPVSCYNCHANTPGTIVITSDYMEKAMGDEIKAGKTDAVNVSCAQCHIEYYFDPATKATTAPYDSMENMNPDDILAFYNEINFVDFTNKNTGVGMIKVQHPEYETFTGKGSIHAGTFNCADCHMGIEYKENGEPYVDHEFTSPLANTELIESTCSKCHNDLAGKVAKIQKETTDRETAISQILVEVNTKLAKAIEDNKLDADTLAKVKQLDRDAQFYWDFVYVENSEGAHNTSLTKDCLDKAEKLAKEALSYL